VELKAAVEQKMTVDYEQLASNTEKSQMPTKPKLQNLKLLKCQFESGATYTCEVELEVLYKDIPAKGVSFMHFMKTDKNWIAIK
jgi:hypothetical protein